jgi:hypothetical protein
LNLSRDIGDAAGQLGGETAKKRNGLAAGQLCSKAANKLDGKAIKVKKVRQMEGFLARYVINQGSVFNGKNWCYHDLVFHFELSSRLAAKRSRMFCFSTVQPPGRPAAQRS